METPARGLELKVGHSPIHCAHQVRFVKELPVKPLGLSLRAVGGIWYNVLNGLVVQSWLFALDLAH